MDERDYGSYRTQSRYSSGSDDRRGPSSYSSRGPSGRPSRHDYEENPKPLLDYSLEQRGGMSMSDDRRQPLLNLPNIIGSSSYAQETTSMPTVRERQLLQLLQQQQQTLNSFDMGGVVSYATPSAPSEPRASLNLYERLGRSARSPPRRERKSSSSRVPTEAVDDNIRRVFCGFVHNEESNLRKEDLLDVFEDFGPVIDVKIPPNRKYAFVSFQHVTAANDAVDALHETSFMKGGPLMKVEHAAANPKRTEREWTNTNSESRRPSFKRPRETSFQARAPPAKRVAPVKSRLNAQDMEFDSPTIFVGFQNKANIQELNEDDLLAAMQPFGTVAQVKLSFTKKVGFVSFENEQECVDAIEALNGNPIRKGGPAMRIEWVKTQQKNPKPKPETPESKKYAHRDGKMSVKFDELLQNVERVRRPRNEEKAALEMDISKEALYCIMCDLGEFDGTKGYFSHITGVKHAAACSLMRMKNKAITKMLKDAADLADFQREAKFTSKFVINKDGIDLKEDTNDRKAYVQRITKPTCRVCTTKFRNIDAYQEHLCTVLHLDLAYKLDQKYKKASPNDRTKTELIERLGNEITSAKEVASVCPMSLDDQPVFDAEEVFGLEKLEKTEGFYCTSCKRDLVFSEAEGHCKSYLHYQKIIDDLKKTKASDLDAKPRINGDEYTIVDEVKEDPDDTDDNGTKDCDMKSPPTGDLNHGADNGEGDDDDEEEEASKSASDFF